MKKYRCLLVLLSLLLVLTACDGQDSGTEDNINRFRVGVVTSGTADDHSFSQSMFVALTKIQNEMGASFAFEFSAGVLVDEAGAVLRDYAGQGFDLVVAHGSQYGPVLQAIAPDFPETSFAWGTAADTFGLENLFAYDVAAEQGGYVNGVLAATLSQSGLIGVIGATEPEDTQLYMAGFAAGAKATNADIEVDVNYIDAADDTAVATAAQASIRAGADALTGIAGALDAAAANRVMWFGTQTNHNELAPDIVVASQVYDWTVALDEIVALVQEGTLGGQSFTITLENSGLLMRYNLDYGIPDPVRKLADEAMFNIIGGFTEPLS